MIFFTLQTFQNSMRKKNLMDSTPHWEEKLRESEIKLIKLKWMEWIRINSIINKIMVLKHEIEMILNDIYGNWINSEMRISSSQSEFK